MILSKPETNLNASSDNNGPVHTTRTGEVIWLPNDEATHAFWSKLFTMFEDESQCADDLYEVMFSAANPTLKPAQGGGVVVTREVFRTELWRASTDLLSRKEVNDAEAAAKRGEKTAYSLTVREAAEILGISPRAVRNACKKGTLRAILPSPEQGYLISHTAVAHYRNDHKRRGPQPKSKQPAKTSATLQVRAGHKTGAALLLGYDKECVREITSDALEGAMGWEGTIKEWKELGVEMRLKPEGKKGSSRFFLLAPKDGANEAVEFEGFYVRGPFEIVEKVNNSAKARARMAQFHKDKGE